jgi:predicted RNA-binding Zn ribbon-like protein
MPDSIRTLETLELVGGAICLDFVNTVNSRLHPEHEYLMQYSDLVDWANKVGILSPAQVTQLQKRGKQNTEAAEAALLSALSLRDLLYKIFSQAAKGFEPEKKELQSFIAAYGESFSHGQFLKTEKHYKTTWRVDESPDALLWPIIYSAGELLLSDELGRVKECPGCGWLFMDSSKNQSRRWCSMNSCGARDKMQRYHKRQRMR